ncbi:TetR/AcrR family transcriptional regulator [Sciscionella sediminilitoris]|uniref:TetR/AcrR family transcriptional regulator n=1 Tax=Sciscionella sediminilitoris TaxID=1445613 RepID=UPI0004DFA7BE|nr:TetR/AcrR family transcriptional regulator [Sciscionella sp. SE31]
MARREQASRGRDDRAGSLWLQPESKKRDPLTRERIVGAALELLDAHGAAALTVRRLAEQLGVAPATLYGYVRTKEDVLDLALDAVYAEVRIGEEYEDWSAEVAELLHAWRNALLRHPWSATVLGRPQLGPHMLAREERLYALLAAGGLTAPELQDAAYALSNYVIGSLLMQVAWQQQDESVRHAAAGHIAERSEAYPTLAAHRGTPDADWDRSFTNGLRSLLGGIAPD